MNHKSKGFYSYKGLFIQFDVRICSNLVEAMEEDQVMRIRNACHDLLADMYATLQQEKIMLEEKESHQSPPWENEQTNTETSKPEENIIQPSAKHRKAIMREAAESE